MKIYIASPFFNPKQLMIVENIERMLSMHPQIEFYSPRSEGVLKDMTPEQRARETTHIFDSNIRRLQWANYILAVIDDRDVGTIWEMGFAYRDKKSIITYTEQDYGLNVMIQESVVAHVRGMPELSTLLARLTAGDVDAFKDFRKFNAGVT